MLPVDAQPRLRSSLYHDRNMDAPDRLAAAAGQIVVFSARSPDKTTPNEDAAAVIPLGEQGVLLAVADGVGGGAMGEKAALAAISALRDVAKSANPGDLHRTTILNGFEEANRRVIDLGVGAATTLAVVEVDQGEARPYHVGDSVIMVMGGRGKIKMQTVSHSPVAYAVQAGYLDEHEAMHHEDLHIVSNVIGLPEMRIEIGPTLKLAPRDTVLLASDGLGDNLHVDEIIERSRKGPLEKASQRLADDTRQRMESPKEGEPSKLDDFTLVLYRRKPKPPASRKPKNRNGAPSSLPLAG